MSELWEVLEVETAGDIVYYIVPEGTIFPDGKIYLEKVIHIFLDKDAAYKILNEHNALARAGIEITEKNVDVLADVVEWLKRLSDRGKWDALGNAARTILAQLQKGK